MPYSPFLAAQELCTKVAQQFTSVVRLNDPTTLGYSMGTLDFVLSQQNENANTIQVGEGSTVRKKEVFFYPRFLDTGAQTDPSLVCDQDPTAITRSSFDVTMSNWVGSEQPEISFIDLQQYCEGAEGPQAFIRRFIRPLMEQARLKLNNLVLADIYANRGINLYNLVTGVPSITPKDIDVLDANGNALTFGLATLLEDYQNHQLGGTPGIIGQGNIAMWARMQKIACCNNGSDASRFDPEFGIYKDLNANAVLGDNNVLCVAPGAMKLLTWAENQGPYASIGQMFTQITLPDPVHNLLWDFEAYVTPCQKKIKFFVGTHWDTVFWPADIFQNGDELDGMTGIFAFAANQQA